MSPSLHAPSAAPAPTQPLLSVSGLGVRYTVRGKGFFAKTRELDVLDDVSFRIMKGETLGLVGESGSGKTTIGRAILRRVDSAAGRILFEGEDITELGGEKLRLMRRRMQLIFQDPYSSLNPRMRVHELIAEPLVVHGLAASSDAAREKVLSLLDRVGLPAEAADRYPHAFSGGQRQRIGIARALALEPSLIIADEPVSALDVSVRAQVVNLMKDLQQELGISFLFIAHDLSVVRNISQRVAILYAGRLIEIAASSQIYGNPIHPYTVALLSAVPVPDPPVQRARQRIVHEGEIPDIANPPSGCRFRTRCPLATAQCAEAAPPLAEKAPGHFVACWNR